tara:strand:+ start:1966 stop:3612 length:1647 start_codon:yes stop_codon:yes gene_type:complete
MPDGRIARFKVPEGTTPEQAQQLMQAAMAEKPKQDFQGLLQQARANPGNPVDRMMPTQGQQQLTRTMIGSAVAEPIAGVSGILGALATGNMGAGASMVNKTKQALTPTLGAEGAQTLKNAAGYVPDWVKSTGKYLSGKVDDVADYAAQNYGPAAGAAVQTLPTAAAIAAPYALTRKATAPAALAKGTEKQLLTSAPTRESLKTASSALYKSIDDMGVTVAPGPYSRAVSSITKELKRKGGHPKTTPKAMAALDELTNSIDPMAPPPKLSDLDTYREIAKAAAKSIEPREQMLGKIIINKLDDFVDKAAVNKHLKGGGDPTKVGEMYKQARDLWGRQKRSEMITNAVETAQNRASGIENGVRVEFRKIVDNPKKAKWFTKEELGDMRVVIRGTKGANYAKAIGRLAPIGTSGATNMLSSLAGIGVGASFGGTAGAVLVPAVGMISRPLARRLTLNNARFAESVIRAGKDGKKIVSAYLRNTPKGKVDPSELAELLLTRDAITDALLAGDKLTVQALEIASKMKAGAAGITGGTTQGLDLQTDQPQTVSR